MRDSIVAGLDSLDELDFVRLGLDSIVYRNIDIKSMDARRRHYYNYKGIANSLKVMMKASLEERQRAG